jgi:hypothetical protein
MRLLFTAIFRRFLSSIHTYNCRRRDVGFFEDERVLHVTLAHQGPTRRDEQKKEELKLRTYVDSIAGEGSNPTIYAKLSHVSDRSLFCFHFVRSRPA